MNERGASLDQYIFYDTHTQTTSIHILATHRLGEELKVDHPERIGELRISESLSLRLTHRLIVQ